MLLLQVVNTNEHINSHSVGNGHGHRTLTPASLIYSVTYKMGHTGANTHGHNSKYQMLESKNEQYETCDVGLHFDLNEQKLMLYYLVIHVANICFR